MNEVVQVYVQDVRQKKIVGQSAYKRPNRSRVLLPSDLIKDWKYARNGRVKVYNMYTKIIPKKEFDQLPYSEAKAMMEYWRRHYSNREIAEKMQVGLTALWRLCKSLNITDRKPAIKDSKDMSNEQTAQQTTETDAPTQAQDTLSMLLTIDGTYSGEELADRLVGLAQIVRTCGQVKVSLKLNDLKEV